MTGKTHMMGGLLFGSVSVIAGTACGINFSPTDAGIFMMGTTVGALLNDIDCPNSMISRKLPVFSFIYQAIAAVDKFFCRLFKQPYQMGHRGITHSLIPWTFLLVALLIFGFELMIFPLLLGLIIGAYSHIALDSMNYGGDPWFMPFSSKKHWILPKFLRIPTKSRGGQTDRTGKKPVQWKENLVLGCLFLGNIGTLWLIYEFLVKGSSIALWL